MVPDSGTLLVANIHQSKKPVTLLEKLAVGAQTPVQRCPSERCKACCFVLAMSVTTIAIVDQVDMCPSDATFKQLLNITYATTNQCQRRTPRTLLMIIVRPCSQTLTQQKQMVLTNHDNI